MQHLLLRSHILSITCDGCDGTEEDQGCLLFAALAAAGSSIAAKARQTALSVML
jgi:hypothetical protein